MMFVDGFGALGLSWKASKLRNGISVFEGSRWFCSRVFLDVKSWFWSGKPSLIYREGVGMDKWENDGGFLIKHMWLGACSRMTFLGYEMVCSDLVCFTNQLVLVLSTKKDKPRELEWPVMHLDFNHFGKKLEIAHGSCFEIGKLSSSKLTFVWTLIGCLIC